MIAGIRGAWIAGLGWMAVVALLAAPVQAAKPRAPVPPTQEIEVLDPSADPLGQPAVELKDNCQMPGCQEVVIPPVVLVHRYFYTGDRSFQAQLLPGGPSIVVVNHPRTGERCYVPVQMLPGAPVVRYTPHAIEYDYGAHGITLSFGLFGKPKVTYRNHVPVGRQVQSAVVAAGLGAGSLVEKAGLPELTHAAAQGTKNFVGHAAEGGQAVGSMVTAPVVQVLRATPLGSIFSGGPGEFAQHHRDQEVRRAADKAAEASADIPTVR
jgi:hypothetical protein